jgi:hypothetical protein
MTNGIKGKKLIKNEIKYEGRKNGKNLRFV